MSTATLTSLAMLKLIVDEGGNYLDYLRPFILQVLVDRKTEDITETTVKQKILQQFGLDIPEKTIQLILKRLCKERLLRREKKMYHIENNLPAPAISTEKSRADRHISALTSGLIDFSRESVRPILSYEDANIAIQRFLSKFDVICLRAYLRGSAIPHIEGDRDTDTVLVSKYVMHLQETSPERFESLSIMVQGHMFANALLCPDLINAPRSFARVNFFLDTQLCLRLLGLHGKLERDDTKELITLLKRLDGKISIFEHTREEIDNVIRSTANHVNDSNGRMTIAMVEARRQKLSKSDLMLLADKVDSKLEEFLIGRYKSIPYDGNEEFQISETIFGKMLEDNIPYSNPTNAIKFDINSVRSIYALRKGSRPLNIEKSKAIMVTGNPSFAKIAWQYDQEQSDAPSGVSSVVTDFTLANVAWLKAPMGAPALPNTEILAFAYAALRPSKKFLDKLMDEIDKLDQKEEVTPEDHQLLRSSPQVHDELMGLMLGDASRLTETNIYETLNQIKMGLKKEESEKTKEAQNLYEKTKRELDRIKEEIYWRSKKKVNVLTKTVQAIMFTLIFWGVLTKFGLPLNDIIPSWLLYSVAGVSTVIIASYYSGMPIKSLYTRMDEYFLNLFIRREAKRLRIEMDNFSNKEE